MYINEILFIYSLIKILLQMLDTLDNFITNVNDITTALHEYRYIFRRMCTYCKYILIQKVPFIKQLPPCLSSSGVPGAGFGIALYIYVT